MLNAATEFPLARSPFGFCLLPRLCLTFHPSKAIMQTRTYSHQGQACIFTTEGSSKMKPATGNTDNVGSFYVTCLQTTRARKAPLAPACNLYLMKVKPVCLHACIGSLWFATLSIVFSFDGLPAAAFQAGGGAAVPGRPGTRPPNESAAS